ncbi:MAG TPA: hypothetical protein PLX88_08930 [Syntrophorhabdaceae bacterium]|nr:hypothetical protein [Syntrophorhabdaceae bacterium]MDI9560527.1 hypothetical protein [Pseudomonadota bacterium]OQC51200.1 MAG: hypothetical protein BWX58_00316 [Deltaproteobacteria bacterium ADurb.Bin026]MBP8698366.1 hypothetical protein [Syntrophorhabdaceae bacterium]MBV6505373.1 hypothetical protein [Syntrophorhabdaceae bacterium]
MGDYTIYLRVGDYVYHKKYARWGVGVVVEERRSEVPGGFCYVRINFEDGKIRVFDNNYKSVNCCYYAGIKKIHTEGLEELTGLRLDVSEIFWLQESSGSKKL